MAERSGWKERHGRRDGKRGLGIACTIHEGDDRHSTGFAGSNAFVEILEDGKVAITSGEGDYGQGCHTVFAQIAAEVLGIPLDDIDVRFPDTDSSPYALGPWGSRITISGGNAVRLAAEDARRQLLAVAADMLEAPASDLDIEDGKVFVKGSPDRFATVAQVATTALYRKNGALIMGKGTEEPPTTMMDPTKQTNPRSAYSFAAQVAEVEVDVETGEVELIGLTAVHDLGRVINPMAARGQVEGAVAQGIGFALTEDMRAEGGKVRNASFKRYDILRAPDMPDIAVEFVESDDPHGPFGAKGLAEPALIPTAPAIANAIYDAVGVRMTELPITADKFMRALDQKRSGYKTSAR